MALKTNIQDVLTRLAGVYTTTQDTLAIHLSPRVWNDQLGRLRNGDGYTFQVPAVFVETIANENEHSHIGQGITAIPLIFRLHLVHEHMNTEGSFDEDLAVFDLRDKVVRRMRGFKPTHCAPVQKVSEGIDYDHDNYYHYTIDYRTEMLDITGSDQDTEMGLYTQTEPPIALELDVQKVDSTNDL